MLTMSRDFYHFKDMIYEQINKYAYMCSKKYQKQSYTDLTQVKSEYHKYEKGKIFKGDKLFQNGTC